MPVRKARNRILRELADAKNLEFRQRMVGRTLSAVTLQGGGALSENYLRIELARSYHPNAMVDLQIGHLTETGLRESPN
jgi:tRNA A37 methylthiotransferase MiaB